MNPPFGAQKAHADRPFIDLALRLAPVTYGIFNAGSTQFVKAYTEGRGKIAERVGGSFPIKRTFSFHTKDVQEIEVEILTAETDPLTETCSSKNTITGLAAAHMVTDIYMPVLPAILPLLIAQNGYSYLAAGLLVTTYNLTSSCIQPAIGWLSDKKGLTISVSISLFISAVFVALMGIAHNYYLIMVFAILAALGHACFHPTALTIVSGSVRTRTGAGSPHTS